MEIMRHRTKLQACRKAAGWKSARAFAEHIGMSVGTYTAYEQGKREMSLSVACLFADALGCSLDDFRAPETEYYFMDMGGDGDDQA